MEGNVYTEQIDALLGLPLFNNSVGLQTLKGQTKHLTALTLTLVNKKLAVTQSKELFNENQSWLYGKQAGFQYPYDIEVYNFFAETVPAMAHQRDVILHVV